MVCIILDTNPFLKIFQSKLSNSLNPKIISSISTTNKSPLPIAPIHSNQLDIKQQSPIHPRILQNEIQCPLPRKRRRLRPYLLVLQIVIGVR
mmetsp:Transcript_30996/g.66418  ORF Transcript_30996/g.66418 Transcript_30996/m.66418 type:complete len:92 (-) Transcript_30996:756-1031(-)